MPYGDDEVAALLQAATDPADRMLLPGPHAGLRAQECTDLCWADVQLARRDPLEDGNVLLCRAVGSAWRRMQALCAAAEVTAKGAHALRHAGGTRLYAESLDLEATARHPGHSTLENTRNDVIAGCEVGRWRARRPCRAAALRPLAARFCSARPTTRCATALGTTLRSRGAVPDPSSSTGGDACGNVYRRQAESTLFMRGRCPRQPYPAPGRATAVARG